MKWGIHFDVEGSMAKIVELEAQSTHTEFWNDPETAQKTLQQVKQLKKKVEKFEDLNTKYEELLIMIELAVEEGDESVIKEITDNAKAFQNAYEQMRTATLLSGVYDGMNAIVTLHSGAGGTEACDWANMLLRMYTRWAEKRGYEVEILDYLPGEETGVKSVTFQVNGENAYGYLKCEKGVHRLIRLSPFDSSGKRHTSFASCDVMPELDETVSVDIDESELRIDTYRSSGAGGQHVNKTDSAIRITHLPTGTVVSCQNERSQHKNKDRAMKVLKARLFELKEQERKEKFADVRGEVKDIGWSSQIRTYVFHPYSMAKDHRTNFENGNITGVMDGNIDGFINAYLLWSTTNNDSE